jgi:hypothetical protein
MGARNFFPELRRIDLAWDPIREDPRFKALLAKYVIDGKNAAR